MSGQKIVVVLLLKKATNKFGKLIQHPQIRQDLRFQKIQAAVLKATIALTEVTSDLEKLKNNRVNCQRHQKISYPCHQNLY